MSGNSGGGSVDVLPLDLFEFLSEAELDHYYSALTKELKVTAVSQLKYVEEDDLVELGLTKPEIRRLRKHFLREYPQTAVGKLKKRLTRSSSARPADRCAGTSPEHLAVCGSNVVASVGPTSRHLIPSEQLELGKVLGEGEFCTVYQAVWNSDRGQRLQVAAKVLEKEKLESQADFLKEVTNMHGVEHRNIVRLYGVVLDANSLKMVTELAPLRSLLECLKEPALRSSFTVPVLCDFAQQVAEGMCYLENQRLIHRDLAARNILVFSKDRVKISDFGMSRALSLGAEYYQTNFNVNLKLPIAWCAPECINYLRFTTASDVWAWGVTLWEMFGYGFQPWAGLTGQQILAAVDEPSLQRLEQPDSCPTLHYQLMLRCWDHETHKRPSFSEICSHLPKIIPERFVAVCDSSSITSSSVRDQLVYRSNDTIILLDKKPSSTAPSSNTDELWRGVTLTGKTGFFNAKHVVPFVSDLNSPNLARTKGRTLVRRESERKDRVNGKLAATNGAHGRLHAGMISLPKDDFRHTGHIGSDGTIFGDVSFIGEQSEKLPVKIVLPYKASDDLLTASSSIASLSTIITDKPGQHEKGGQQALGNGKNARPYRQPSPSAGSTGTFTSVSTLATIDGFGRSQRSTLEHRFEEEEVEKDDGLSCTILDDFDFQMPRITTGSTIDCLDFGSSLMDDIFKCLSIEEESKTVMASDAADGIRRGSRGSLADSSINGFSCDFLADFGALTSVLGASHTEEQGGNRRPMSNNRASVDGKTLQASSFVCPNSVREECTPTEERSALPIKENTFRASSNSTVTAAAAAVVVPCSPALSMVSGLSSASSLASARSDGRQNVPVRPLQSRNQDSITSVSSVGSSVYNGRLKPAPFHQSTFDPPKAGPESISSASSSSSELNSPTRRPTVPKPESLLMPSVASNHRASTSSSKSVVSSTSTKQAVAAAAALEPIYAKPNKTSRAEAQREARKATIGCPVLISGPIPANATPLAVTRSQNNAAVNNAPNSSGGKNPLRALRGGSAVFRATALPTTRRNSASLSGRDPPLPPRNSSVNQGVSRSGSNAAPAQFPSEEEYEEPYQSVMDFNEALDDHHDCNESTTESFWGADFLSGISTSKGGMSGALDSEAICSGMSFTYDDLLNSGISNGGSGGGNEYPAMQGFLDDDEEDVLHL